MAALPPIRSTDQGPLSFRAFLESKDFCALTLSPLIAAIADASEGVRPTTIDNDESVRFFGCPLDEIPNVPRRTVATRAGARGGKTSRLLATKMLHAAWTVPVPTLNPGEVASALIVAPDLKLARQALSFVKGYVEQSDVLRAARVGEPTLEHVDLVRPDGKRVRVEILAATRGGRAVRGRVLVAAGLEEAAFFFAEGGGVVNDTEIYDAVLPRVAEGGQVWIVSTPWVADVGLLEALIAKNWGNHQRALCVTAPTRKLNPTWDPTGEIEADMREQDPDKAAREIDAIPMSGGSNMFFDPGAIKKAVNSDRKETVRPSANETVAFGGDLAFANDSSALVGVGRDGSRYRVLVIEEMRPAKGAPLRPKSVVDAFADTILEYGADALMADGHYRESAREHLEPHDIAFRDAPGNREGKTDSYLFTKKLLHEGRLEIPNHARLLTQLRAVIAKPAPGGGYIITSPRERSGGGHGDVVSALVLAVWAAHRGEAYDAPDSDSPDVVTYTSGMNF